MRPRFAGFERSRARAAAIPLLAGLCLPAAAEPPAEPLDLGTRERVEVQFVLLDVVALDRGERTVPGLVASDFDLLVDGDLVEVESLDTACGSGALDDPRAGAESEDLETGGAFPERRIVFAFNYAHLSDSGRAVDAALRALAELQLGGEEHMVVALGAGVQVRSRFGDDPQRTRAAIEEMAADPRIHAGHYGRLTERATFTELYALLDLLEPLPGRKIVLLFSDPLDDDGFVYDQVHRRLASLAARARAAIYPVDARGMTAAFGWTPGDLGGPPRLARLATETGGRLTWNSNDLSLGYARAQRDLGCTYTLGFHDTAPRLDRDRRVAVYVRRRGIRVVHPSSYVVRSAEERLEAKLTAALMAPEMFGDKGLEADLLLVRPRGPRRWEALAAVEASSFDPPGGVVRGLLRNARGTPVERFRGTLGSAVHVEPFDLRPGRYELIVAVAPEGSDAPRAMRRIIEVPEVPRSGVVVVGPLLGRQAAPADPGGVALDRLLGKASALTPLAAARVDRNDALGLLTHVCRLGAARSEDAAPVVRRLSSSSGAELRRFERAASEWTVPGRVDCRALLDWLPANSLDPGEYEVSVGRPGAPDPRRAGFTVR